MNYPSDTNDTQFGIIEKYFFVEKDPGGRKKEIPIILILNAIFYVLKT